MSRGYRCVVPGCMRRVDYGLIPRLFCDQCWVAIDAEIGAEPVAAFQDIRRKRPGSLQRWTDAKRACHDAAAAAGVIATLTQTGDEAAVTSGSPSPGEPPAATSSPPAVPDGDGDGRQVGADGVPPAIPPVGPSASTTPQAPVSPAAVAGEQEGEGGADIDRAAVPHPPLPRGRGLT